MLGATDEELLVASTSAGDTPGYYDVTLSRVSGQATQPEAFALEGGRTASYAVKPIWGSSPTGSLFFVGGGLHYLPEDASSAKQLACLDPNALDVRSVLGTSYEVLMLVTTDDAKFGIARFPLP